MDAVRAGYMLSDDCEITMECNPGTVSAESLAVYKDAGINRISFGLQSADDGELRRLGRIHSYEDFLESYEAAVRAGFTNINVDLMSTVPGQDHESFKNTLLKVTGLNPAPTHISAYSLIIEPGTPFYEMYDEDSSEFPDEDEDRAIYHMTGELLGGLGYKRYEISNYAREGYECRHNIGYWTGTEYLGLGLGAASYYGGRRYSNVRDISAYLCGEREAQSEMLGINDLMTEFMILGLRMTEGVSTSEFASRFGRDIREVYGDAIDTHISDGLLTYAGDRLMLTERGLDLANTVMTDFVI